MNPTFLLFIVVALLLIALLVWTLLPTKPRPSSQNEVFEFLSRSGTARGCRRSCNRYYQRTQNI